MESELRKDLNIITLGNDKNIVYAPLRGVAFYANNKAVDVCKSYIEGCAIDDDSENAPLKEYIKVLEEKIVQEPRCKSITISNLVVILSQMCNLSCSYCYAHESRSKDVLNKNQLKAAIDYIMALELKQKHFSFIGGGEPTLTWELLKWSIRYIRTYPIVEQKNIGIGITTNGTLLDDEKIDFFKENNVFVGLSFEILPDIQSTQRCFANSNRKTFEVIDEAIKKLVDNNVRISFRSTITKLNVMRMPEMVIFVSKQYPFMKKLHFEHVTSTNNDKAYYDDFIHYFIEARKIGQSLGIEVYCSVSHALETLKSRFCKGEFCLTPTGEFVSCHRISSKEEKAFELFKYAQIKDGFVSINMCKKECLENFYNSKREECAFCFAKWHCAGSCAMERTFYSEEMRDLKCYFTKELIKELLIERLNSA